MLEILCFEDCSAFRILAFVFRTLDLEAFGSRIEEISDFVYGL